jgi:hypothetical protein
VSESKIEPHKITKPMQLLGAWLVGLVITDGIFLGAAVSLGEQSWERGVLVLASIANVPLFLFALFLLQTRFRAELQEDTFYSEYINKKSASPIRIDKDTSQDKRLFELEKQLEHIQDLLPHIVSTQNQTGKLDWTLWPIALNDLHPNFEAIRESLRKFDIPVAVFFGTINNSEPPKKWVISISPRLPINHCVVLLQAVLQYGFDGIDLSEPEREIEENEDVYIGSYASDYANVTPALQKLLDNRMERADLVRYCQLN